MQEDGPVYAVAADAASALLSLWDRWARPLTKMYHAGTGGYSTWKAPLMMFYKYTAGKMKKFVTTTTLLTTVASNTLQDWNFTPLPLGSVRPSGWLRTEMESMANGLAGHEHDFYTYVSNSTWLQPTGSGQGIDYSNLNEALPYWFNGLVPLAYQLDDGRLKDQVRQVADAVLGLQDADGWVGPEDEASRNFWARIPMLLGMTQLVEADKTWETRVVAALRKFMTLANSMLHNDGLGLSDCPSTVDCTWGQARVHDLAIVVQWLLEKYPDDSQDSQLWETMMMFYQYTDFKWDQFYVEGGGYQAIVTDLPATYIHGVNVGQGLKASAVWQRMTGNDSLTEASRNAVDWTLRDHGAPSGTILADEWERDLSPYMGSELCTAVETAYSLAYMYQSMGAKDFADKAERVIFNALPVMMTSDHWAHQYMDQPNQPWAKNNTQDFEEGSHIFTTSHSGLATIKGMEPQYPCCTVNHPQGYPKFVSNSWVTADGGHALGHALLGPSEVSTELAGGNTVSVACDTLYPFSGDLSYTVTAEKAFALYIRVPVWAEDSPRTTFTVSTGGFPGQEVTASPDPVTGMHKLSLKSGKSTVDYHIDTTIRIETRANSAVSIYYGSVLYALQVTASVTHTAPHGYEVPTGDGMQDLPFPDTLRDYFYTNTSSWAYAIDISTLKYHGQDDAGPAGVFDESADLSYISVDGCPVEWNLYLNATPDWPPIDPTCVGPREELKMVRYGAATLHMAELPKISLSGQQTNEP